MRVALVSTYDLEGGAARAATRLLEALRGAGADATHTVLCRSGALPGTRGDAGLGARVAARLRWRLDHAPASLLGLQRGEYATGWLPAGLARRLRPLAPEVVHLHWVQAGFVAWGELARVHRLGWPGLARPGVPLLMTAHDMAPFTGGCHYDAGCARYQHDGCTRCPMQARLPVVALPAQRLRARRTAAERTQLDFVCPSRWMAGVARSSPVAAGRGVHVIPNAIDTRRFKPFDRAAARALLGLPTQQRIVLFGAVQAESDRRKGFHPLQRALALLPDHGLADGTMLATFGTAGRGTGRIAGLPVQHLGTLHDDESLIAAYAAADVFVAPSLQDNLPNTVLEAAACGLPTVGFDVGGMSDLVQHGRTGWLAEAGQASALAEALATALRDETVRQAAGRAAREHAVARFSYPVVAAAHLALYRESLAAQRELPVLQPDGPG